MGETRFGSYTDRVREQLREAFTEDHTPREVAGSFAIGTFVTMLPTLGLGFGVFVVLALAFGWVSKLALLASALVFNPAVKWGVYASSFALGVVLLGPIDGVAMTDVSLSAGPDIVLRLLVGNLILAAIATVVAYAVAYRLAVRYETTAVGETIDDAVDEIVDEVLVP